MRVMHRVVAATDPEVSTYLPLRTAIAGAVPLCRYSWQHIPALDRGLVGVGCCAVHGELGVAGRQVQPIHGGAGGQGRRCASKTEVVGHDGRQRD